MITICHFSDYQRTLSIHEPVLKTLKNSYGINPPPQAATVMNRPHTVFIVEDDPIGIELLTGILEQDEYSIRAFYNPEEVISEAVNTPPSLFLLDVMMSGIDGFEPTGSEFSYRLVGS